MSRAKWPLLVNALVLCASLSADSFKETKDRVDQNLGNQHITVWTAGNVLLSPFKDKITQAGGKEIHEDAYKTWTKAVDDVTDFVTSNETAYRMTVINKEIREANNAAANARKLIYAHMVKAAITAGDQKYGLEKIEKKKIDFSKIKFEQIKEAIETSIAPEISHMKLDYELSTESANGLKKSTKSADIKAHGIYETLQKTSLTLELILEKFKKDLVDLEAASKAP